MKKQNFYRLFISCSPMALAILLAPIHKVMLFVCLLMGLCAFFILWNVSITVPCSLSKMEKTRAYILSILFCIILIDSFIKRWSTVSIIHILCKTLHLPTRMFVGICSIILSLFSFYTIWVILIKSIPIFLYNWKLLGKLINKKELRNNLLPSKMRSAIKTPLLLFCNIIVAGVLGLGMLVSVYHIPQAQIESHVASSAETFAQEGTYPSLYFWCTSQLDNYTDAIMLLEAVDHTENTAFNNAILAHRGKISNLDPCETLVAHYINRTAYDSTSTYSRYWHGYHIILKPLLFFTNYHSIRTFNACVQLALVILVCTLMVRRGLKMHAVAYVLSYFMLMPVALAKSIQFSTCFYILTFGSLFLLLLKGNKSKPPYFLFLNIGIATAYFDFLTYPIATFGVPALLYLCLHTDDALEKRIGDLIKTAISWAIGYGGMWSLKWIIGSLFTEQNTIAEALNAFIFRASHSSYDGTHYTWLNCALANTSSFFFTPASLLVLAFILWSFKAFSQKNLLHTLSYETVYKTLLPFFIIGSFPFLWYAFAMNHSTIHCFFTNKACMVFILAVMFGLAELGKLYTKKA